MEKTLAGRDNNFNFLRLFFALSVLLSHSTELIDGDRHREPLTRLFHSLSLGEVAVDCFFILSGFLIVQSWERKPILLDFLKKRVLRIYPAFVVASLVSALVVGPLGSEPAIYFAQFHIPTFLKQLFTLLPPDGPVVFKGQPYPYINGPMWSIAYEFRCYLLVALFGLCGLFKYRNAWLLFFIVAFVVGHIPGLMSHAHFPGSHFLFGDVNVFFRMLPFFCVGGLFHLYREKIPLKLPLFLFSIIALLYCFTQIKIAEISLIFFGSYALFYIAFTRFSLLERFKKVSDVSYGLYLYGWPIQKLLFWYFPFLSPWLAFPLASVSAILCGLISWKVVEQPFLRLKTARVVSSS